MPQLYLNYLKGNKCLISYSDFINYAFVRLLKKKSFFKLIRMKYIYLKKNYNIKSPCELNNEFLDLLPTDIITVMNLHFKYYKIDMYKFALPPLTEYDLFNMCMQNKIYAFAYTIVKSSSSPSNLTCYIKVLPAENFDVILQSRYINAECLNTIPEGINFFTFVVKRLEIQFKLAKNICSECSDLQFIHNFCRNTKCKKFKIPQLFNLLSFTNTQLITFDVVVKKLNDLYNYDKTLTNLCEICKKCKICQRLSKKHLKKKCKRHFTCNHTIKI